MNVLASTSTACYGCVAAQAASTLKASRIVARFSSSYSRSSPKDDKEDVDWKNVVWPKPATLRTRSLIEELKRLQMDDKVKIDRSVLVSGKEYLRRAGIDRRREWDAHDELVEQQKPNWKRHREALKEKFPEGWNPPRRVERNEMNTIRRLHSLDPIQFSTPNLADKFKISAEAVRRILKSKFRTEEEEEEAKIGDELLKVAELGAYDKTQQRVKYSSKMMSRSEQEDVDYSGGDRNSRSTTSGYAERTSTPAKPLQDGFDPNKLSKNYRWAAGRKSKYAHAKSKDEESERVYQQRWQMQRAADGGTRPQIQRTDRRY